MWWSPLQCQPSRRIGQPSTPHNRLVPYEGWRSAPEFGEEIRARTDPVGKKLYFPGEGDAAAATMLGQIGDAGGATYSRPVAALAVGRVARGRLRPRAANGSEGSASPSQADACLSSASMHDTPMRL